MGRWLTRIIGVLLIIAGLLGLVFAGVGLYVLVQVEKSVVSTALDQVAIVDQALVATVDGLNVAETSLTEAVDTVRALEVTVSGVGDTITSSVPVIESMSALLGDQLPAIIGSTQKTLQSVADSTRAVDQMLSLLSGIPFLGVGSYAPEISLSEGFGEVAISLEGIPESLQTTKAQLLTANENLAGLQDGFDTMATNIGGIATSVGDAQAVLTQYKGVIAQLQSSVDWISSALPIWVFYLRLGLSALLIWLGIAQFALITQGWELIGRSRQRRAAEAAKAE